MEWWYVRCFKHKVSFGVENYSNSYCHQACTSQTTITKIGNRHLEYLEFCYWCDCPLGESTCEFVGLARGLFIVFDACTLAILFWVTRVTSGRIFLARRGVTQSANHCISIRVRLQEGGRNFNRVNEQRLPPTSIPILNDRKNLAQVFKIRRSEKRNCSSAHDLLAAHTGQYTTYLIQLSS